MAKKSTKRRFFSTKVKPKTVFALVPTQKLLLLRCFSLAFDKSKTRLHENVLEKNSQNSKESQLRDDFFSVKAEPKTVFALVTTKS